MSNVGIPSFNEAMKKNNLLDKTEAKVQVQVMYQERVQKAQMKIMLCGAETFLGAMRKNFTCAVGISLDFLFCRLSYKAISYY